ncbi:MAG: response regulator [Oscillospiraceae bacterium]|nr:response regulator [Oscillospiraceae bacterium]
MKRFKLSTKASHIFVAIVTVGLIAIMLLNISLMYKVASVQTEEIGRMRIQNISAGLQKSLTRAENTIERVSKELDEMLADGADEEEVREFLSNQRRRENVIAGGICINVFCVVEGNVLISDMETPEDYVLQDRMWYRYFLANQDKDIYISPTYKDAFTDSMCFSVVTLLSDGRTILVVDYSVAEIQSYIDAMKSDGYGDAIIVDENETIVGYTDPEMIGQKLASSLPQYRDVFLRALAMDGESSSMETEIGGMDNTIFCSRTENGWYMMCSVSNWSLYRDIYVQLLWNFGLSLLLVLAVALISILSIQHRKRAEADSHAVGKYFSVVKESLDKLRHRLKETAGENASENTDSIRDIDSELLNIIKSLQDIQKPQKTVKKETKISKRISSRGVLITEETQRVYRVVITLIFVATMIIAISVSTFMTTSESHAKMEGELNSYNHRIGNWVLEQQSILDMFENVIAAKPDLLDDYDKMVKFLDDITRGYPKISATYIANPDFPHGHPMVMNNGWVPEPDYVEEERPWYIGALTADSFNLTEPYYDARTGEYCITFSKVVQSDAGDFYGVFAIDFYMDVLYDILGESYSESGYAFLVDKNGIIIDHPNPEYHFSDNADEMVNIHDLVYDKLYSQSGTVILKDYDGRYKVCASIDETASGFRLFVVKDWWRIYGNVFEYVLLYTIIFGVCITAVNTVIHRMTEWQRYANKSLKEAAESAIKAEQVKSMFLSNMSHEIRTPINAVLGMNEMILRECRDEKLLGYAENIRTSGKTLLFLINDILDMQKIESGKMNIVPVEYETASLVTDLWNMTYIRAKEKNLAVRFILDENMPSVLFGDDVRIKQIAVNLLTNAVKYTPEGSVEMHMSSLKTEDGDFIMKIAVQDTGLGIKEEDMENLFKSFQRLDEEKNRNIEGAGLGMSITMSLLKLMDGDMKVESEYRKGSTFTVTIPQKVVNDEPTGDFESVKNRHIKHQENAGKIFEAPKANVLVVDDNAMNLEVFKALLGRTKVNVDTADSGKKCLELIKKQNYHIIFMDHMMPEMDGIETLHEIKKLHGWPNADTPVVALTANAISGVREMYIKEGFNDYLTKPIDGELLEQMVVKYLPEELVTYADSQKQESGQAEKEQPPQSVSEEAPEHETYLEYGISVKQGLGYSAGDMELYLDLVGMFVKDRDKRQKLEQYLADVNMKDYSTIVHALKGNAKTLGASGLSEIAFEHEKASKDGDAEFVKAHWDELLDSWNKVREGLAKMYLDLRGEDLSEYNSPADSGDAEGSEGAEEASDSTFAVTQKELSKVADLIDDFESIKAAEQLKIWLEKPLEQEMHDRIEKALTALKEVSEDEAMKILRGGK